MTLRDQYGEVEVGIGDLFKVKDAEFSVICPEFTTGVNPSVWVRLLSGVVTLADGRRIEVESHDGKGRPFLFTGELLAGLIRAHRLMTFDIAPPVDPPARIEKKTPRAQSSKERAQEHKPTTGDLF